MTDSTASELAYKEPEKKGIPSIEESLAKIASLIEIGMLCKTAEAVRAVAKGSVSGLYETGWQMAENLALLAHKKITNLCKKEV